jgi:hypothetical protein
MSKTVIFLFGSACFIILFWVVVLMSIPKHGTVVYDCRLAEISPDYPIEVKEKCRKLSSGRL